MNNITHGKTHGKKNNGSNNKIVAFDDFRHPPADSKVLQEIIDILKYPFQTSCDTCNGLGFIRSGEDCHTCKGTGKVIDNLFRK